MDWFQGTPTGNQRFSHEIWGFPVKFHLDQSIDKLAIYIIGLPWYVLIQTPVELGDEVSIALVFCGPTVLGTAVWHLHIVASKPLHQLRAVDAGAQAVLTRSQDHPTWQVVNNIQLSYLKHDINQ